MPTGNTRKAIRSGDLELDQKKRRKRRLRIRYSQSKYQSLFSFCRRALSSRYLPILASIIFVAINATSMFVVLNFPYLQIDNLVYN